MGISMSKYSIITLRQKPEYRDMAAGWFHEKWDIPLDAYTASMDCCLKGGAAVPEWYLVLHENTMIAGAGVIENDFHDRKDLTPNVCAVYVEEAYRNRGIAGELLDFICKDMREHGIATLYLVTDHIGFYERYGWEFLCMVQGDGEPDMTRMYVHRSRMDDIFEQVEKNMDGLIEKCVDWTSCAAGEQLQAARAGKPGLKFFDRDVPEGWLKEIRGKKVLCLAGAGGLQAPLLACAGAEVTVLDLSNKMLDKDREIAARENLQMRIIKGNMCDLSMFEDGVFDYIINPPSLMYVPDVSVVFRECCRMLRRGGVFIMMAPSPVNYLCDYVEDKDGGYYKAVHRMLFCSKDHDDSDWIEYGHTMEEYLGGLTACGLLIDGYMECQMKDITELYFMVRAVKNV